MESFCIVYTESHFSTMKWFEVWAVVIIAQHGKPASWHWTVFFKTLLILTFITIFKYLKSHVIWKVIVLSIIKNVFLNMRQATLYQTVWICTLGYFLSVNIFPGRNQTKWLLSKKVQESNSPNGKLSKKDIKYVYLCACICMCAFVHVCV